MPKLPIGIAAVVLIIAAQVILPAAIDLLMSFGIAAVAGWTGYRLGKAA